MCDHVVGRDVDTDESGFLLTWPWPPNPSVWPSGTGVALSPPITPTIAWYDPSDLTSLTVAGGLCSQMNDKSGNGRHQTAAGANRPTSGVDTINGRNVLLFASNLMTCSVAVTQALPVTLFAVVRLNVAGGGNTQIYSNLGNTPTLYQSTGDWAMYAGSNVVSATACDTNAHVLDGVFNGASSILVLDRTQIASGNPGAQFYNGVAFSLGTSWPGDIGELLMYASALSTTDRQNAENYLRTKWGTP
jgi:hypothetical protein